MATGKKKSVPVQLDTRWIYDSELPLGGLTGKDFDDLLPTAIRAHRQIQTEREKDRMGFFELADPELAIWKQCRRVATQTWKKEFTDLVVLGIGGSALGARALQQALAPETIPGSPESMKKKGKKAQRVWFLDNVDPGTVLPTFDALDPKKTLVNVISKSGGTVETAAQLLILAKRFQKALGTKWREHFVFTTDPEEGELRRLANQEDIATLEVPPSVGGRFSVLSAVGLFPAALMGVQGQQIVEGAVAMRKRCESSEIDENPAYFYAAAHKLLGKKNQISVSVLMPYCDKLQLFGQWYSQLWAESLGKRKTRTGKLINAGFTPVVAMGATDQHSQLQLYLEGPKDKLVTLLSVENLGKDVAIPAVVAGPKKKAATAFLGGHKLGELFKAERDATKAALCRNGVPVLDVRIPAVNAHSMGELIFFFEVATVFAGELLGVNPMDQPAVEVGKRYANALMGRPGFEDLTEDVTPFLAPDTKFLK